jgi:hypothetical protein
MPPKCTGITALVFFVIDFKISFGSIHNVVGSMSTNTGLPPFFKTQFAVETKLIDGIMTSLSLISKSETAIFSAAVPLFTAKQSSELTYFLN